MSVDTELGRLSGLVETNIKVLDTLTTKLETQSNKIDNLSTNLEVFKTHGTLCRKEFDEINEKLTRDFRNINELQLLKTKQEGVVESDKKRSAMINWFIAIVGGIVAILISVNQLIGIKTKVSSLNPTSSVFASELVDSTKIK